MRSLGQEGDQNMGRSRTIIKTNHGSDHQYFGDKDHNGRLCDFILARQNRIRNIDNRQVPVDKEDQMKTQREKGWKICIFCSF